MSVRPKPRLNRRKFLVGAGATGALVVAFAAWPRRETLNLVAKPGETILNGWLKIGSDGQVTVVVPQAEMGQGVTTSLPQVLADELGADWRTVGVEPAPLHPIYANKAMIEGATQGMPGFARGAARWALGAVVEHYALQMTGGSTSMMAFHDTLRHAGATARVMLCKAAARQWELDWTECDTANGFVVHKANRMRFADLAAKAAEETPPSDPPLRARPRLIGRSVPRLDVPSKTDGSARFGIDVRLPGMAYAAVRGGPVDGGALTGVDAAEARRRPGVRIIEGPTWVAAVADTWWGARTALDTVKPTFARAAKPAGPWMDAALAAGTTRDGAKTIFEDGDASPARGTGAIVADYVVPALAHACLEPMNATARIENGRAEVWAPTQSVTLAAWAVARALDIGEDAVTIFPTLLGGGFGRKAEVDAIVQAVLIARNAKRPVQLIWTREEDTTQDKYRPPARARMRATLGADKRIAAWDAVIAVPDVDASFLRRALPAMGGKGRANGHALEGATDMPYTIDNLRVAHADVELPVPYGYWRSVGHSFNAFFVESFVDELAFAAKLDPLTFRLRMMEGFPRHAAVLKAAASHADFGAGEGAQGIALHESFGSIVAMVIEVEPVDGGIKVTRATAAVDCGHVINPDIVRGQIEGAIIFGLSAALKGAVTFKDGAAEQTNFDSYTLLPMNETPEIEVLLVPSGDPLGGVGEIGVPPVAPALANAIFAATGKRLRSLPLGPQLA